MSFRRQISIQLGGRYRQVSLYHIMTTPWLLRPWVCKEPTHQQSWYMIVFLRNFTESYFRYLLVRASLTYFRGDHLQPNHKHKDHPYHFHKTPPHSLSVSLQDLDINSILFMFTCFRRYEYDCTSLVPNIKFLSVRFNFRVSLSKIQNPVVCCDLVSCCEWVVAREMRNWKLLHKTLLLRPVLLRRLTHVRLPTVV